MKRLTPVVASLVSLLLAVPAAAAGWTQVAHDAGNTGVAGSSPIKTFNVRTLSEVWTRTIPGDAVVVGKRVFIDPPGNAPLSILNLDTGSTIDTIVDGRFTGPPAIMGGMAIVQRKRFRMSNGHVKRPAIAAYRLSTGTRAWSVTTGVDSVGGVVVPPTVAKGVAFPGGRGGGPARPAIKIKTGKVLFRTRAGGATGVKVAVGKGFVATASANQVRVYRARTGKLAWSTGLTATSLSILGPKLIAVGGGRLSAFNLHTGARLWQVAAPGLGSVTVVNKLVIGIMQTGTGGFFTGWSGLDGHRRWQRHIGTTGAKFSDPVMVNGVVLFGWQTSNRSILVAARRTSGGRLATLRIGNGPIGNLTVAGNTVLAPMGGILHALQLP